MPSFDYVKPRSLKNLINELDKVKSDGAVLAGGTDLIVKIRTGMISRSVLFDINELEELNSIVEEGNYTRIGATTRIQEIANSEMIKSSAPMLSLATSQLGSPQIRNRATVGGNILSASPAADTVPPLMAMGAKIRLQGPGGEREVSIEDFMKGPSQTGVRNDEVLTEVVVPKLEEGCRSHFFKVGRRRALAISLVNLAGWVKKARRGTIEDVRIVLGAVAPTAIRAKEAEAFLKGKPCSHALIAEAAKIAGGECNPITDVRATENGRRLLVEAWTYRLLQVLTS